VNDKNERLLLHEIDEMLLRDIKKYKALEKKRASNHPWYKQGNRTIYG